ncbi:UDP-N-acetylglucosamine 2-epimerase (non-hydrolyzing) [Flavobacteriales bacterium]|nr:UDP-N-acetylglucosamine 2-epimerase (non-hydrolyzing) [Flavobacteriales bacterium]
MKIATIVGTRPELIKLSEVIKKLDNVCDHLLIHTGQNFDFELNEIFFKDLEIRKPNIFLEAAGDNFAYTISQIISKSYDVLVKEKPDAILLYGDTNSCLCVIVAKRLKIPVFHMEAGNRCFDERVPEELNRKIVDHLSDINMPISDHARKYLEREGILPETIIKIGSSMPEVINNQKKKINSSNILAKLNLKEKEFIVVSLHREENVDSLDNLTNIVNSINEIVKIYKKKVIFSIHPRTKSKLISFDLEDKLFPNVIQSKPFGFNDYIKLQQTSFCVISDSGTISEESSILKFPAITIRQSHERPEAMDEGTVIMTGFNKQNIIDSIKTVTNIDSSKINTALDYRADNISEKVVRIIFSYVDYVNRNVWKKF